MSVNESCKQSKTLNFLFQFIFNEPNSYQLHHTFHKQGSSLQKKWLKFGHCPSSREEGGWGLDLVQTFGSNFGYFLLGEGSDWGSEI